jgi:hypothetical protein
MSEPIEQPVAFQPDAKHVIAALQQELAARDQALSSANENRVYLAATIRHMQEAFSEERALWEIEKASLLAERQDD